VTLVFVIGLNVNTELQDYAGGGLLPTERQRVGHERALRRSVALLASVVVVFSVSWLPLNLYHVLTDFHPDTATFHYSRFSTTHIHSLTQSLSYPHLYAADLASALMLLLLL